jgi:hypothetical protein
MGRRFLAHLLFLPNVMPLTALLKAEIFPWATLYSAKGIPHFSKWYKWFLVVLGLSAAWMFIANQMSLSMVARSLFAFVNATIIFFYVLQTNDEEYGWIRKAFERVLLLNLIIVFLQYFHLFPVFLEPAMQWFIDRFKALPFGGGRGVAGLFAEPSYAGISLYYYFAFYMFAHKIPPTSRRGIFLLLGVLFAHLIMIRSLAAIFLLGIYVLFSVEWRQLLRLLIPVAVLSALLIVVFGGASDAPRALAVPYAFFANQEFRDPAGWLLRESGFRFVSVAGSYAYLLTHPFGAGVGNWQEASLVGMEMLGVPVDIVDHFASTFDTDFDGVRPYAFFAGLAIEGGWLPMILLGAALWPYLSNSLWKTNQQAQTIRAFFLFTVLFFGVIGDPLPFLFLAMTCRAVLPQQLDANNQR